MQKRVLITGGAGFIGSNLSRHLAAAGYQPIALDDLSLGKPENLPAEVPLYRGDVANPRTWTELPPAEAVVHLAGASSAPMFPADLAGCFHNNVVGFIRVLDYARLNGAKRVVYASTSSVYGNVTPPLREDAELDIPNFYAVSKYCMEHIARMYTIQHGLDIIGLRFMSVYGPREEHKSRFANLISQFIWDVEAGRRPIVYGDGNQSRDFTNVADIAQAIRRILDHSESLGSTVFNVGTGRATTVNDLIAVLSELMERPIEAEHIPNPVATGYVRQQLADISKISATVGYQPTVTLREGVREILAILTRRTETAV